MRNIMLARAGAVAFALWGARHIAGGAAILAALRHGPDAGFTVCRTEGV
jgi:hypothetical protein